MPRVLWRDATQDLRGWVTTYANGGGSLRTVDLEDGPIARQLQACWVAVEELDSYAPADDDTQRVLAMLRKLLERGSTPPVHPETERALLEAAGVPLADSVSGDLVPGPADPDWRPQLPDGDVWHDRAADLNPDLRLDSDEERAFLALVPDLLGPAVRWVVPQASLDQLLMGRGKPELAGGHRRVDFLLSPPWQPPLIVEVDGTQHDRSTAVDAARDQAMQSVGIDVIRIPVAEIRSGSGPNLDRLAGSWTRPRPLTDIDTARLLAGPAQIHRMILGIVNALQAGFLAGDRWVIDLHDDLNVVAAHLAPYLEMVAAVDALWGPALTPDEVQVISGEERWSYVRAGLSYQRNALEAPAPVDVRMWVEQSVTSVEVLPETDPSVPTVVVRAAVLPVAIADQPYGPAARTTPRTTGEETTDALTTLLQAVFAKAAFRDGQLQGILEVLRGGDCVVLLPTGAGKSLIYQLAGLCLPGRTIVIDPIVALMEDQVRGLRQHGLDRAVAISSRTVRLQGGDALLTQVANADAHFVLVAPERLQQSGFRQALRQLAGATPINLAVIDEAHCVSEWGHDFRTAYLNLGKVLRDTCKDTRGQPPPLLALTGTASRAVLRDVLSELGINPARSPTTLVRPDSFDRPELTFDVVTTDPSSQMAGLKGYLRTLPGRFGRPAASFFAPRGRDTFSGLVFCPHVEGTQGIVDVAAELRGIIPAEVAIYGGRAPRTFSGDWESVKRANAERFKNDEIPVLVTTKSFGMGIDKPNVRWVAHYGIPGSMESYYQEAGRAGRDGREARCALILCEYDEERARRLLSEDIDFEDAKAEQASVGRADADDITRALWFQFKSFPGIEEEMDALRLLVDEIGTVDRRRTVDVPFDRDDRREPAIHRLAVLGFVRDYLVNFGSRSFELHVQPVDETSLEQAVAEYVRRSQPGREVAVRAELEAGLEGLEKPSQQLVACARVLTAFVYDVVERSRRRSLREMWLAAREADGEVLRRRILEYLSEGDAAPEVEALLDQGRFDFADWSVALDGVVGDPDAGEWRGVAARLLGSEPDHPGLLLVRAVTELELSTGELREYESNLVAAVRSATALYSVRPDGLEALARWLVARSERRPASLAATYHAFAVNGHDALAARVRAAIPGDVDVAGLDVLELATGLERVGSQMDELAELMAMRRW